MEVDTAATTWIERYGTGSVSFLTLTMPHDHGEKLADLLQTIRVSFAAIVSGEAWQTDKERYGLRFYIVAYDATVGVHGWHPHLHIMLFGDRALDNGEVRELGDRLYSRWVRAVTNRGHRAPTRANGLQFERAHRRGDLARYVCQIIAGDEHDVTRSIPVALELARGDLKTARHNGQRTPWQVLDDLSERRAKDGDWTEVDELADERDVALWREWEKATKGVRAIRWANGLRAAVGLTVIEKTDDEIVAEKIGGENVYTFVDVDRWKAVASTPGGRAAVLRAAESRGAAAVGSTVEAILRVWRGRRGNYGRPRLPAKMITAWRAQPVEAFANES